MAVHLSFLLILTGLTGIHSITTVSKVSVKAEGSISIPCLYGSQYRNHVKYLCKGYYWNSCSYAVKTNQPDNSGKFSISDDKSRRIFTVTIKHLTYNDAYYWCAVEINGGGDVRQYFDLSVTGGTPSLHVAHQQISAVEGGDVTINCYHQNSGEMRWCRLGSSCVTGSSGSLDRATVTINATVRDVVTVTMSGLRTENSGWYWCVKKDQQMPVHVTVTEQPTTYQAPTTAQDEQNRVPFNLKSLIIPLSLLILIVMVALFIWFMLKRHRQTKAESATTRDEEEVTYSNVKHLGKTSSKRPDAKSDMDVVYSSVVITEQPNIQRVEAKAEDVTYSSLAHH